MRILVIEDEPSVAKLLRSSLEAAGHEVATCGTGAEGLRLAISWSPDVALLDMTLPDIDGAEVCRQIRASSDVGIIIVSGRVEEAERVTGLDVGADDYIAKPFSIPEVKARIRAVSRRMPGARVPRPKRLVAGDLTMDLDTRRVFKGEVEIPLSKKEFDLLLMLMERPGIVISRADLARAIWGQSPEEAAKALDVHMSWVRRKLGDDVRNPYYIETVRGVGFRLIASSPPPART